MCVLVCVCVCDIATETSNSYHIYNSSNTVSLEVISTDPCELAWPSGKALVVYDVGSNPARALLSLRRSVLWNV